MNAQQRQIILDEIGIGGYLANRRTISVGDIPIHCELYESGDTTDPLVLLLPGIGTYCELYAEFLSRFSQLGYNVVGIDPRGHGYSGGTRGRYALREVVEDIQQVVDKLRGRYSGPLILFGSSFGARLALAAAESPLEVDLLVCHTLFLNERSPDLVHRLGWNWIQTSSWFAPLMVVDFRHFIDVRRLLADTPLAEYADRDELMVWRYPLSTLASVFGASSRAWRESIGIPALILVGEHDPIISPDYLTGLVRQSAHTFDLSIIPTAAHMLPFVNIGDTLQTTDAWIHKQLDLVR